MSCSVSHNSQFSEVVSGAERCQKPWKNRVSALHGIKPLRLNGSFDSKCTRPETSHSYQSFTILINTSTGIIVDLKEYSVILTTSFYDINQKILTKKGYFQSFS